MSSREIMIRFSLAFLFIQCLSMAPECEGMILVPTLLQRHSFTMVSPLMLSKSNDGMEESSQYDDLSLFQQRKQSYERNMAKGILQRPPNPFLSPEGFVQELLRELREPHDSQSGYLCLLESSTMAWRKILYGSVGTSKDIATNVEVAASLKGLFQHRVPQFGILVGMEDLDHALDFPCSIDFLDGTSWVECRFYRKQDNELLVVTGWSLKQRETDGAWQLDKLEWQDFRDSYRPGIGREEWERICG